MTDAVIDAPLDGGNPDDTPTKDPAAPQDRGGDKALADGGGTDKGVTAPADWPEDWRTRMGGADKDALKALERYKSPLDVAKALREAQKKISSGQIKPTLPNDASEDDIAAFRKELGVPEKPEGYLAALPNGLVIGEDDKPIADAFLEAAHKANMPPELVGTVLNWYYKTQESQAIEMSTADKTFRASTEDELRGEWGGEYRANLNTVKNFLDAAPAIGQDEDGKEITLGDLLRGSRAPDGRMLGDHPGFLRWVADMANKENPAGFVAPAGGGSQIESVEQEIAKIEKVMRDDRATYNKDTAMQARLVKLYDAKMKIGAR